MNEPIEQQPRRIRWWPGAVVVLLGSALIAYAQLRWPDEATWRDAFTMIGGMAIVFFLLVWWLFASRASLKARLWTGGGVLALGGLFLLFFEVDELSGSMIPSWRYRFAKSAEEKAVEYFADSKTRGLAKDGIVIDADDWPGFRGPNRDGVSTSPMRTDWNANPPKALWRHPIGVGWSSFAIVDGLAFTQEQRGPEEVVSCFDVRTGKQLWVHADAVRFTEIQGGDGPRATPTIHDGRLYAQGATGILNCLDPLTGKRFWSTNILDDAGTENLMWGMCGSPLVVGDLVIVNPGLNGDDGKHAVAAYDRVEGNLRWATGKHQAAYAAPRVETLAGVEQVLIFDAAGLSGHSLEYGTELWHYPWRTFSDINVAQPIKVDDTHVLIGSGYSSGLAHGTSLVEITRSGDDWSARAKYVNKRGLRLKFQSAVRKGDYVYGLDDRILACDALATGKRAWKDRDGTYGFGQLLLVGDHIVVTVEKTGEVALVKANPEAFEEVGRFQALGIDTERGNVWNHPAIWNGLLLVRNAKEAACYDLRP